MQCEKLALYPWWVLLPPCQIPSEGAGQIRTLFEIQENIN